MESHFFRLELIRNVPFGLLRGLAHIPPKSGGLYDLSQFPALVRQSASFPRIGSEFAVDVCNASVCSRREFDNVNSQQKAFNRSSR